MFHNYIVQYPQLANLISVDVGTAVNCTSLNTDPDYVTYYGNNPVYINGVLQIKQAQQLKIARNLIIMQWTSESV